MVQAWRQQALETIIDAFSGLHLKLLPTKVLLYYRSFRMSAGAKPPPFKEYLTLPANHTLFILCFLALVASFCLFSQTQAYSVETPAQSFLNKNPEGAVESLSDNEVRRLLLKL